MTRFCLAATVTPPAESQQAPRAAALVWAHLLPGQVPDGCVSLSGVPCNEVVRGHLQSGADSSGAGGQNMLAWSQYGRQYLQGALSVVDTDMDGLPDADESMLGTDPLEPDTDNDGFKDGMEVLTGSDPLDDADYLTWGDLDGNGVVNAADVVIATHVLLGQRILTAAELVCGNVASLVAGVTASSPDDNFTVGDLLLISGKATGAVNFLIINI
jgi:hypothetical protein